MQFLKGIRTGLWFIPVACVVAGVILSIITIQIDHVFNYKLIPESVTGGPDAALQILSTVAASMVSLATLVLTITMVVVQLAMGQFSPRIVKTFLEDVPSQIAIGLFVATFAHAMLTLREVNVDENQVPGVAIVTAYLLVVASIIALVIYVDHIGRSLRVAALIELVGKQTRNLMDKVYPDKGEPDDARDEQIVAAAKSGVVTQIDHDALVELATIAGCRLELIPALGEFVPAGSPLVRIHGERKLISYDDIRKHFKLGLERTLEQDVAYGLRMLVDIAERSLADSPFQDPTSAVQAIDRLHDCLRQLVSRPLADGIYRDDSGKVRLTMPVMDWNAYVTLAFEEIRQAGYRSPQVSRRLQAALEDLERLAPPERQPVLVQQRELLEKAVRGAYQDDVLRFALESDHQGIGVRAGRPPDGT